MMKLRFIILAFVGGIVGGFISGNNYGRDQIEAKHDKQVLELVSEQAKAINAKQVQISEIERAWLDEDQLTRVIYKDRIKTVVKEVQTHVKNIGATGCVINDNGLQLVNTALLGTVESENTRKREN